MANVSFTTSNGSGDDARKLTTEYDFGNDLQDAIAKFGEEVIFDNFVAAAKVDVQGLVRRKMNSKIKDGDTERDYTDEEITAEVEKWVPTKKGVRQSADPLAKATKLLDGMSPAQLAELKAKLAALG